MLVYTDARLLKSFSEGMFRMYFSDARLLESGSEAITRMLVYSDAYLSGCSITGKRFRRDDSDARQPDAQNIVAQSLNAFSIGFVLLGDHRSVIADLILTDF